MVFRSSNPLIILNRYYLLLIQAIALLFVTHCSFAQVSGVIWQDFNASNTREPYETPQANITVRAFDNGGHVIATAVTDTAGKYKLDIPDGRHVRVEFTDIPEGYVVAFAKATTQFVTSPAEISLGIYHPGSFAGVDPQAVQTVYARGDLSMKTLIPISSLVKYPAFPSAVMQYSEMTLVQNTGSLWGLAYDRQRKVLFSSAIAKRHSALGSQGPGGIYRTSIANNDTKPFVNLDALGFKTLGAPLHRELTTMASVPDHDSLMFSQVGKIGLGGLDISDDSRYLFTVNLYDRHLYRIKLNADASAPKASDISRFPLPIIGFTGGEARPFAVKYYNGKVYVGIVSDAQASQKADDLVAFVYAIEADDKDPATAVFEEVTRFSLNYPRGVLDYKISGWFPWTDDYLKALVVEQPGWLIYPQPVLSDIEFDTDGSMIVALMDRTGHQSGDGQLYRPHSNTALYTIRGLSGGDVVRLSKDADGYHLEQNGQSGSRVSLGRGNGQGPGGGEFYYQDNFVHSEIEWHQEDGMGGLALVPALKSVMASVREPVTYVNGGARWYSSETGASAYGFAAFPSSMPTGYFWKTNNVGDIELITPLPRIEIGDRVWADTNANGIQDPDEPVLSGILMSLYRDGQFIAGTESGPDGRYSFHNESGRETIRARTNYEIRIPLNQPGRTLTLTQALAGDSRELDSDAKASANGYASIFLTTKNPGEDILDLDIGFQCADQPQVTANFDCQNNVVKVSLSGYDKTHRFDLVRDSTYSGKALYASAGSIPVSGAIAEEPLQLNKPFLGTVRIFSASGCFQDVFLTSEGRPGCAYVPESLLSSEANTLVVYPNPTSGIVNIAYKSDAPNANISIQITDVSGRRLKRAAISSPSDYYVTNWDLTNLAPGVYRITVTDKGKKTTTTLVKK